MHVCLYEGGMHVHLCMHVCVCFCVLRNCTVCVSLHACMHAWVKTFPVSELVVNTCQYTYSMCISVSRCQHHACFKSWQIYESMGQIGHKYSVHFRACRVWLISSNQTLGGTCRGGTWALESLECPLSLGEGTVQGHFLLHLSPDWSASAYSVITSSFTLYQVTFH